MNLCRSCGDAIPPTGRRGRPAVRCAKCRQTDFKPDPTVVATIHRSGHPSKQRDPVRVLVATAQTAGDTPFPLGVRYQCPACGSGVTPHVPMSVLPQCMSPKHPRGGYQMVLATQVAK